MTLDLALGEAVPGAVLERLRGARRILAISHENPDADTIGAGIGVALIAERLGARTELVCTDPIPETYAFLPLVERFRTEPDPAAGHDLLVLSDCAALDRIGAVGERHRAMLERLPRVVIDHHASNAPAGPADWIDPTAAATCEMVALLAGALDVSLDAADGALAGVLMAGIVMDTATFAHPNTTPRTLALGAALVAAGAPLSDISRRLYRTKPARQLRLFGRVLAKLEVGADGAIVWSTLLDADLTATGARPEDSEGIIDLLSQAAETEVAILFKEAGGATRVSVRTRPGGVDSTVLTGQFGGGGHARAAGATVDQPIAAAIPVVLAAAERLAAVVRR